MEVCTMQETKRRPLMFQIDSFNDEKKEIERRQLVIEGPIGGSFKVSDGRIQAEITINALGIEVKATNTLGHEETIYTKKV